MIFEVVIKYNIDEINLDNLKMVFKFLFLRIAIQNLFEKWAWYFVLD